MWKKVQAWVERTRRTKSPAPFRGAGFLVLAMSYAVAFVVTHALQRTLAPASSEQ